LDGYELEVLRVRNWTRFQHYKNRRPPWIRLYGELLDNYEYSMLPDASRSHLIGIWLLASRLENAIPNDPAWIQRMIHSRSKVDVSVLVSAGFLEVYQDASKTLADCKQLATPETETETETETENPLVREGADRPLNVNGTVEAIHQHFNARRGGKPLKLTAGRRTKYRARLKTFSPAEIIQAIDAALSDPFYRGENDRNTRYDFPETVLKNDEAVDRHLQRGEKRDPVLERAAKWSRALDA
jgi:hypothetical protein